MCWRIYAPRIFCFDVTSKEHKPLVLYQRYQCIIIDLTSTITRSSSQGSCTAIAQQGGRYLAITHNSSRVVPVTVAITRSFYITLTPNYWQASGNAALSHYFIPLSEFWLFFLLKRRERTRLDGLHKPQLPQAGCGDTVGSSFVYTVCSS